MKEERTSSVPVVTYDDYHDTIELMHHAQGYRMIGVEYLNERHYATNEWIVCHHLVVEIKKNKLVHYTFLLGKNGNNTLYYIESEEGLSFEDAILSFTKAVCHDGQANLIVFPM